MTNDQHETNDVVLALDIETFEDFRSLIKSPNFLGAAECASESLEAAYQKLCATNTHAVGMSMKIEGCDVSVKMCIELIPMIPITDIEETPTYRVVFKILHGGTTTLDPNLMAIGCTGRIPNRYPQRITRIELTNTIMSPKPTQQSTSTDNAAVPGILHLEINSHEALRHLLKSPHLLGAGNFEGGHTSDLYEKLYQTVIHVACMNMSVESDKAKVFVALELIPIMTTDENPSYRIMIKILQEGRLAMPEPGIIAVYCAGKLTKLYPDKPILIKITNSIMLPYNKEESSNRWDLDKALYGPSPTRVPSGLPGSRFAPWPHFVDMNARRNKQTTELTLDVMNKFSIYNSDEVERDLILPILFHHYMSARESLPWKRDELKNIHDDFVYLCKQVEKSAVDFSATHIIVNYGNSDTYSRAPVLTMFVCTISADQIQTHSKHTHAIDMGPTIPEFAIFSILDE